MSQVVFLPDDLIVEILSYLPVKPLVRSKSVCKSWNSLISDPKFGKLRLQRSKRNSHIAVIKYGSGYPNSFVSFPLNHLFENPSITVTSNSYHQLKFNQPSPIIGSCNGLLCLLDHTTMSSVPKSWFRIWNPTTRIISVKFGSFNRPLNCSHNCTFGYDKSTRTYKVVVLFRKEVQIFSLGDNRRKSLSFPSSDPFFTFGSSHVNKGVYLSGTVNWYAIQSKFSQYYCQKDITVGKFVIISLDLGTETYKQFQTLSGVDEVPDFELTIAVLMDCLCFSHNLKNTHFVIWQMMEFGVEQSWTQFLKISFQNLLGDDRFSDRIYCPYFMFPLWLSKNGDTLLLANTIKDQAILYNLRDNRAERTSVDGTAWKKAICYVQSKASIC
ncbi:F-box protein interaction domain protein [Medicago truncatula]|uniref:F-box protein interaction domain protein n=1 Tax=Medicago truncatula TaxID=3880 RepID=A0A072TYL9_MEDTR|nr:F-box protein interaction domain protein [Medicago truncatula]